MRIDASVPTSELPLITQWFDQRFGRRFDAAIANFQRRTKQNPFFKWYAENHFQLEFNIDRARTQIRRQRYDLDDRKFVRAVNFLTGAYRFDQQLTGPAQDRFRRRFAGLLGDPQGLQPLAAELDIAVHVSQRGYDFVCADLEEDDRHDFTVSRGAVSFEIECKSVSREKGLRVKSNDLADFGQKVSEFSNSCVKNGDVYFFFLQVSDKLPTSQSDLADLSEAIRSLIGHGEGEADIQCGRLIFGSRAELGSILDDANEVDLRAAFPRAIGCVPQHILFHGRRRGGKFLFGISASSEPKVTQAIYEVIEKAADQLSGQRPSVVYVQLPALSEDDLNELIGSQSALYGMAGRLWRGGLRAHVNQIVYASTAVASDPMGSTRTRAWGSAGVIPNANPAFACPDLERLWADAHKSWSYRLP